MLQDLYRLLMMFALVLLLANLLLETLRNLAFSLLRQRWLGAPEFDVARNVMHLVYAQSAAWVGLYFSPMLPVLLAIVYMLTYYVKKV